MRKIYLALILGFISIKTYSQTQFEISSNGNWTVSENANPPVVIDSISLDTFMKANLKYPSKALAMMISGDVVTSLTIDKNGQIQEYEIIKHIGAETDEEINSVLKNLQTNWTPASLDGNNVESKVYILFKFNLGKLDSIINSSQYFMTYAIMATGGGKWEVVESNELGKKKKKNKKKKN